MSSSLLKVWEAQRTVVELDEISAANLPYTTGVYQNADQFLAQWAHAFLTQMDQPPTAPTDRTVSITVGTETRDFRAVVVWQSVGTANFSVNDVTNHQTNGFSEQNMECIIPQEIRFAPP
eukprot:TRINITY_DN118408_c0_g1_i1.p1 TRINITY_DN118408_c0_g1~~TRINITY_DN118408_c0_g1_i1.p1  ORF type:complete len:120 (-),score=1.70 TRINITY_DN118408_c0_g1_i1:154-513(-)